MGLSAPTVFTMNRTRFASRSRTAAPLTALSFLVMVAACSTELDTDAEGLSFTAESAEQAALRTNTDPNRLVVYTNNIENMIFDWNDLVHAMEQAPLRPDVVLLQQVTSKAELDRLANFMSLRLGADYDGLVAQNRPDDLRWGREVSPRPTVTTGIIYRTARFDVVRQHSWMPFGRGFKNQPKTCDVRANNSGYETLRVKLHDKLADEDIVAVSTRQWTWHACTSKNMRELVEGNDRGDDAHPGLGTRAALHIVAGDFNDRVFDSHGNYRCWYRELNGSLGKGASTCSATDWGFTDPLYEACNGDKACVRRRAGIDDIFVRRSDGQKARTSHFDVITFDEAHRASVQATGHDHPSNRRPAQPYTDVAGRYSGHLARRAYLYYR